MSPNPEPLRIRSATPNDFGHVARLIHHSTNAWYKANRGLEIFEGEASDCRLFPETYAQLPGSSLLLAGEIATGRLVGSCFAHNRPTHFSLGILNVQPDSFGLGVARRLVQEVIAMADLERKSVRLVSSLLNLDSFSLYSRLGFVPRMVFQDMQVAVPPMGMWATMASPPTFPGVVVRAAQSSDVPAIAERERQVAGIARPDDWGHFVANPSKIWTTLVAVRAAAEGSGEVLGALAAHRHTASHLIGPGIAHNEQTMAALLWAMLDTQARGASPIFLLPSSASDLVKAAYSWGARNVELHAAQCRGAWVEPTGVVMPTFLPETF